MLLALPVLALLSLAPATPAWNAPRSIDEWIAVDDPDLARLPAALRSLPNAEQVVYESAKNPWFLIARRVRLEGDGVAAFAADDKVMRGRGDFVVTSDDRLEVRGSPAFLFECEWELQGERSRILALYDAEVEEDVLHALWIVAPESVPTRKLLTEVKICFFELRSSLKPDTDETYASILNGHALSFSLKSGRGRNAIELESVDRTGENDTLFFESVLAKNRLPADVVRNWRDEDRDLSLSYQIFQTDMGFGPRSPFLHWIAAKLQLFVRGDRDDGDAPVELLHLENARTTVVTEEELERHYANNRRAPESGVILETFVPRSPYARACRLRWTDAGTGRAALALLVELRTYPRSRSETVSRTSIVLLLAHAPERELLDVLETGLELESRPLEGAAPLSALPR
jgi:hypothetical protein